MLMTLDGDKLPDATGDVVVVGAGGMIRARGSLAALQPGSAEALRPSPA